MVLLEGAYPDPGDPLGPDRAGLSIKVVCKSIEAGYAFAKQLSYPSPTIFDTQARCMKTGGCPADGVCMQVIGKSIETCRGGLDVYFCQQAWAGLACLSRVVDLTVCLDS